MATRKQSRVPETNKRTTDTTRQASSGTASAAKQTATDAADAVKDHARSFKGFVQKFFHDWSHHLTQALAFALVSSIIPIGMLLLAIVGSVIGSLSTHARDQFINQVIKVLPAPLADQSPEIIRSALQKLPQSSLLLTVIGILAALFFGSRLFTLLEACFDFIYRVPQRPLKQKNGVAIMMLILFMIFTPVLVLASLIPGQVLAFLQHTAINTDSTLLHRIVGIISSLIVSFLLFEIIYSFVPNRRGTLQRKIRASLPGAITATIVLQIALLIFPLYASNFTKGIVGQIGFALVLLIFFYLISLVTLIGATVNAYYAENIQPTEHDLVMRSKMCS